MPVKLPFPTMAPPALTSGAVAALQFHHQTICDETFFSKETFDLNELLQTFTHTSFRNGKSRLWRLWGHPFNGKFPFTYLGKV